MSMTALVTILFLIATLAPYGSTTLNNNHIPWYENIAHHFTTANSPLFEVFSVYFKDARCILVTTVNGDVDIVYYLLSQLHNKFSVPISMYEVDAQQKASENKSDKIKCEERVDVNVAHLVVVNNMETLLNSWEQIQNSQLVWDREAKMFILLTLSLKRNIEDFKDVYKSYLETLWRKYGLLNVFLIPIFKDFYNQRHYQVMTYQPFARLNGKMFGDIQIIDSKNIYLIKAASNKLKYLNGHPLNISIFPWNKFARINENGSRFGSFYGEDGYLLQALSDYMGFKPIILHPTEAKDYGFYYPNGTSTGTLGHVVQGKAEIALNARFIKNYGTESIAFTRAIFNDDLCIIVPRAKHIPKWLAMVTSFDTNIYVTIFIFYILLAGLWHIFKTVRLHYCLGDYEKKDVVYLFLDFFHPFVSMTFMHIPKASAERMLILCGLFLGLILVSTFQGRLVTVIGRPMYQQDINTLEQLDRSGLTITTSSKNMQDSFANTGNLILDHLRGKIQVVRDSFGLERVARRGDVAAFVRKYDANSRGGSYRDKDGTLLFHVVKECPRSYYLAYILCQNSPYSAKLNTFLGHIFESGIVSYWKQLVANDLINMNVTKKPNNLNMESALKVFTLTDLQLPFLLLGFGLTVSWTVFLIEILTQRKQKILKVKL